MRSNQKQLEIIFGLGSISDFDALKRLMDVAQTCGSLTEVAFESTRLSASDFIDKIKKSGKWSHEIQLGGFLLRFGVVTAWEHCFVSIKQTGLEIPINWSEWVAPFLKHPGFIQAWVIDCDFAYWQNAEQPIQYELAGRDYFDLPLISNGLPPPLRDMWIDISNNPGKRIAKQGYVEAIGEKMWLALDFFSRIGGINVDRLRSAGWTVTKEEEWGGFVLTAPNGLIREDGAIESQRKLRSALYV